MSNRNGQVCCSDFDAGTCRDTGGDMIGGLRDLTNRIANASYQRIYDRMKRAADMGFNSVRVWHLNQPNEELFVREGFTVKRNFGGWSTISW